MTNTRIVIDGEYNAIISRVCGNAIFYLMNYNTIVLDSLSLPYLLNSILDWKIALCRMNYILIRVKFTYSNNEIRTCQIKGSMVLKF